MSRKSPLAALGSATRRSKRRGAFGALANALGGRRRGKSLADRANLKTRRRRSGGIGLDLAKRFFGGSRRKSRRDPFSGLAKLAGRAMADRLSPAEREQLRNDTEQAIQNDRDLGAERAISNASTTQRESFIQRLVSAIRARMR